MREIKFRVWVEHSKRMIMNPETKTEGTTIKVNQIFNKKNSPWIITQFTGLLDKNKKEIYEGDIVKVGYYPTDKGTIYTMIFDETQAEFVLESIDKKSFYNYGESQPHIETMEVIGNVFENKEVLDE